MSHLFPELCDPTCLFDANVPEEFDNACSSCWMSEFVEIDPPLKAIVIGRVGEVVAKSKTHAFFRQDGQSSIACVSLLSVKKP